MAKRKNKRRKSQTINILNESNNKQFDYAEVFRHIRTNIEYSRVDEPVKAISVTSTQPSEAKTTLSMNLAFSFATKYEKVLVIDCDLRKSALHRYLNISNDAGLTDALLEYSKTKSLDGDYIKTIDNDLPLPWVCQKTPILPSPLVALTVRSTAFFTAKYWW